MYVKLAREAFVMHDSEIVDPRYNLTFKTRPEYLYVYVEVYSASLDAMRQYCQKIAGEASRFPARRVLIEKAAAEQLSTVEAFQLASELPDMGFTRIKTAFVDHAHGNEDLNEFTEMVANNRGLNARTFDTVEAAERWLLTS